MSLDKLDHRDVHAYALGLGDDALILAQRLGHWIARAPQIEEDVALGNIGLDLLGQARLLLTYAGEATGQSEDDLAYLREEREFTNLQIVEHPNEDFAVTIARQLVFSTYQLGLYERLQRSTDETLAAIAAKAVKEVDYHRDHATQWTLRLGDGTDESHAKMQAGLERIWPYVAEMFDPFVGSTDDWVRRGSCRDQARVDDVRRDRAGRSHADRPRDLDRTRRRTQGHPHRAVRLPDRGDAAPASLAPWSDLVMTVISTSSSPIRQARSPLEAAIRAVPDPELPVISIADLGILRDISVEGDRVVVTITPTYSGCPAMDSIRTDVTLACQDAGYDDVEVRTVLSPAWTTDWMTDEGKAALESYGVAPPGKVSTGKVFVPLGMVFDKLDHRGVTKLGPPRPSNVPQCGSLDTRELSRSGRPRARHCGRATAAVEPFDHFKAF